MKRLLLCLSASAFFGICAASAEEEEKCTIPSEPGVVFLSKTGKTSPPKNLLPVNEPNKDLPADCEFYRWAWHTFLFVTQPNKSGGPAFLDRQQYPTYEDVFKIKHSPLFAAQEPGLLSLGPRLLKFANQPHSGTGADSPLNDIQQATVKAVLVDQGRNPILYGIHLNQSFRQFITDYRLDTLDGVKAAPPNLEVRPGSVELKSAWMIVEDPNLTKHYFTADAKIPVFKQDDNQKIVPDGSKTRRVKVALIALHVVGVIEGHPEFIWATFEHVQKKGTDRPRDNAPAATSNPDMPPIELAFAADKYALYSRPAAGKAPPVAEANKPVLPPDLKLDAKTQKFSPITPIYRMYPSSNATDKSKPQPVTPPEDPAVADLNANVSALFTTVHLEADLRSNYQLTGAVWLNTPRGLPAKNIGPDFIEGSKFNDDTARDPSRLAGENRMSGTALESFTQNELDQANGFPNCFSCHDTQRVGNLKASRLNVSHLFSKFFNTKP
jgi:hypothetical protein